MICLALSGLAGDSLAQRDVTPLTKQQTIPTAVNFGKPITVAANLASMGLIKGILTCDINYLNCTVRNMPLLNQSDPRIDGDLKYLSPWGCYDTSIVTVISTALANRKPSLIFGGRAKTFASFVGDAAQPKEIKQLNYQYRNMKRREAGETENGKLIQPLYFHEVVANFNNGKILQQCDPFTYGDCDKLGNTAQATNLFGDAGRMWMANGAAVTNETIIKMMESGYVVMLAFMRYEPVPASVSNVGGQINLKFNSFHKIVVSGFRKNAQYPLIVNDVGNGQRYNVSIGSNLANRKFQKSPSAAVFSNAKFGFVPAEKDPKTTTFIEYEGTGKGVNEMIFFLQHYDYLRINQ